MKYTYELLQLIGWPVLIFVSYKIAMIMINRFEKKGVKTKKDQK